MCVLQIGDNLEISRGECRILPWFVICLLQVSPAERRLAESRLMVIYVS
jgi:hypothetical protein